MISATVQLGWILGIYGISAVAFVAFLWVMQRVDPTFGPHN